MLVSSTQGSPNHIESRSPSHPFRHRRVYSLTSPRQPIAASVPSTFTTRGSSIPADQPSPSESRKGIRSVGVPVGRRRFRKVAEVVRHCTTTRHIVRFAKIRMVGGIRMRDFLPLILGVLSQKFA